MRRQNPASDLSVMLVDDQPVAVDDFHLGMGREVPADVRERARQQ